MDVTRLARHDLALAELQAGVDDLESWQEAATRAQARCRGQEPQSFPTLLEFLEVHGLATPEDRRAQFHEDFPDDVCRCHVRIFCPIHCLDGPPPAEPDEDRRIDAIIDLLGF